MVPIGIDTDVNAAAFGEYIFGNNRDINSLIYITVGTGIGVGAIIDKKMLHGLIHPEMGHIIIPKFHNDKLKSVCPFHESCLEGLASGPAMMKRWNIHSATDLENNHIGWDMEANYLSIAIANYILCLSPEKVIIGGGVLNKKNLIDKIRKNVKKTLAGYLNHPKILNDIDEYITLPKHMGSSGLMGALAIAAKKLGEKK